MFLSAPHEFSNALCCHDIQGQGQIPSLPPLSRLTARSCCMKKKSLAVVTSNPCTCTSYWLNKQIRFHSQNDRADSEYINIRFEKQKGFVYSVCVVVYSVKNTLLFSLSLMLLELIYDLSTNTSPSKRPF